VKDVHGLRGSISTDSGPGRTNERVLRMLRKAGWDLFGKLPNTTHILAEMDQLFGLLQQQMNKNMRQIILDRLKVGRTAQLSKADILGISFSLPR
jgi:hypothetical protein